MEDYIVLHQTMVKGEYENSRVCVKNNFFGRIVSRLFKILNWAEEKDFKRLDAQHPSSLYMLPKLSFVYWTTYIYLFSSKYGHKI